MADHMTNMNNDEQWMDLDVRSSTLSNKIFATINQPMLLKSILLMHSFSFNFCTANSWPAT